MTTFFLQLVNRSITAGWLVLAVLLVRLLLSKAPKWTRCILWGMVALRLLCPLSLESPWSLIPSTQTIPPSIVLADEPAIDSGIPAINAMVDPLIQHTNTTMVGDSIDPWQVGVAVCTAVWLMGMILLLLYTVIRYGRLQHKLRTAVRLRDNIYQSEHIDSPFVMGICRPKIYIPYGLDDKTLPPVLAHEQAHIHRKDHWWKLLGFVLLSVYWFHPLLWVAYILLCRDIELACDEKVIHSLTPDERADYTQALVTCSAPRRTITACPIAFGEINIKARVRSVLHYRKPAFWIVGIALVACVIVGLCFLTDPAPADDADPLAWVQNLSAADIADADLVVMPQAPEKQYKQLSAEEILEMAAMLRQSAGKYQRNPKELFGGSSVFYITMTDGTRHSVGNIGNVYLCIDGTYYEADSAWLQSWQNSYGAGNDVLPEGYFNQSNHMVDWSSQWFDYLNDTGDMYEGLTTTLSAFPGVTFLYTGDQIIATKDLADTKGHTILVSGTPIWNAYFCDLTGDGLPELCVTANFGFGMIDSRITICDYANGASYTLADRGKFDYALRMDTENQLYVDKSDYTTGEQLTTGRLCYSDGCIQIQWENGETMTAETE